MQKFTVHKVPTIDVIDELVGLNIFKANLLKICYHREINNKHEDMVMVMYLYSAFSIYIFKCGLHYFSAKVRSDISIWPLATSSNPPNT